MKSSVSPEYQREITQPDSVPVAVNRELLDKKKTLLITALITFFIVLRADQSPRVATITAFIVCILFSASSKTIEFSDSKTSSVTSIPSRPNFR